MAGYSYSISPLGDAALLIDFGSSIDAALNGFVHHVADTLRASGLFNDVIPAYSSIGVYFDVPALRSGSSAFENVRNAVEKMIAVTTGADKPQQRLVRIPVCYAERFAPDLHELAVEKKLSTEDVISIHTSRSYHVYMIGFLPGFPYMGEVDERIASPRRPTPRTNVPAGSVGIAGAQTGIYPINSPGGWNIIGNTPMKMFDVDAELPTFLYPGDHVKFYSITEDEYDHYAGRHS